MQCALYALVCVDEVSLALVYLRHLQAAVAVVGVRSGEEQHRLHVVRADARQVLLLQSVVVGRIRKGKQRTGRRRQQPGPRRTGGREDRRQRGGGGGGGSGGGEAAGRSGSGGGCGSVGVGPDHLQVTAVDHRRPVLTHLDEALSPLEGAGRGVGLSSPLRHPAAQATLLLPFSVPRRPHRSRTESSADLHREQQR